MAQVLDIVDFGGRGACPTLNTPMPTGDGLLARVRIVGGRLTPEQLAELARLALQHGNGLVEVTARGNLQVRGLSEQTSAPFAAAVAGLVPVETGLVIDASPIAGEDPEEKADPRVLAEAIREGVADFEHRLGPKVSVVVDGGGQVSLRALKADVRLVAVGDELWSVEIGGALIRILGVAAALHTTLDVLDKIAALGIEARASDVLLSSDSVASLALKERDRGWGSIGDRLNHPLLNPSPQGGGAMEPRRGRANGLGPGAPLALLGGKTTPVALPFGAIEARALLELAEAATGPIRLTQGHMLLLDNASPALIETAAALGFITSAEDPRLRVSACIGSDGCASGFFAARQVAARLACHVPSGETLHVSGCAKGCAHPRPAALTLVGRSDGIGLVIGGRAGDTASQVLEEANVLAVLAELDGR